MKSSICVLLIFFALSLFSFIHAEPQNPPQSADNKSLETAAFAGGCFWCMEPPFDELEGVISTTSGYTGGQKKDPTYEEVSSGGTGHTEAVQVVFDPAKISYAELLDVFWKNIDPTTPNRQFCDIGSQYRTAIFYHNEEQQRLAKASKKAIEESGRLTKLIVTEIAPASEFYVAEEYHQDYYKKNPIRYKFYRYSCGRDEVLEAIWGESKITARP
jgi:peptide-methionine (S)-S-oxide reductase